MSAAGSSRKAPRWGARLQGFAGLALLVLRLGLMGCAATLLIALGTVIWKIAVT